MKKLLFILLSILATAPVFAQTALHQKTDNSNAWIMYFGDHKVSSKWGIHLEAQLRRTDFLAGPQQLLLRTGINYHLNPQVFFTAGYCYVETYPYGEFPAKATYPEHRIWEQMQIKTPLNSFEWISRFRLEQRFSEVPVLDPVEHIYEPGAAIYTNRFRMLNRFSLPFRGKTINDGSFYISAYDEVFVSFGKAVAANYFDQNRAYIALGYRIPHLGRLEVGYMEQTILKGDGIKIENNHTLQVGLISNIDFYKSKKS